MDLACFLFVSFVRFGSVCFAMLLLHLNTHKTYAIYADGYTVLDVLMYWKPTPVRGVDGAELPQFSMIGYETNDRKVSIKS